MALIKVFISSVQKEFFSERENLYAYFNEDNLLSQFFTPVMFEKLPAATQSPNKVYMDEVESCDIYLGILGSEYGYEDSEGISPTEREYDQAKLHNKERWIFLHGDSKVIRHAKEEAFISKVGEDVSRKRFTDVDDLLDEVNRSCILFLQRKGLINHDGFDHGVNATAKLSDINDELVSEFVSMAKKKRGFPLSPDAPVEKILTHLNLIRDGQLINSALLVFAEKPQQFFPAAVIKCAHFHTPDVRKPIPDHKVFKGDVFKQVDQAVDFVLSKISLTVGTRNVTAVAPVEYEIPVPVITEAIVNAVAHRDYTSTGSVQVMLFPDRIEIMNPGKLPPELSIGKLKIQHSSYPANPLLAECLYQTGYIERFGTGTLEMISLSAGAHLPEPLFNLDEGFKVVLWRPAHKNAQKDLKIDNTSGMEHVTAPKTTPQVTPQVIPLVTPQVNPHVADQATDQVILNSSQQTPDLVERLVMIMEDQLTLQKLMHILDLKDRKNFRESYLNPSIKKGLVEMTNPDKPTSSKQKYRLTAKGKKLRKLLVNDKPNK